MNDVTKPIVKPKRRAKPKRAKLLVPMLADNWALCLASGFVGGKPRHDAALDVQSLFEAGIVGKKKLDPWMLYFGEDGPRVILQVDVPADSIVDHKHFSIVPGLVRVTDVKKCQFTNAAEKDDFIASYGAFPDVPVQIVQMVAKKFPKKTGEQPAIEPTSTEHEELRPTRSRIDAFCGWAGALKTLFEDDAPTPLFSLSSHADAGGGSIAELSKSALLSVAPSSTADDIAIWRTLVAVRTSDEFARGGDRRSILSEVEQQLQSDGNGSPVVSKWLAKVQDVLAARCDLPPLNDGGSIGQRAALALLLDDPSGALPTGPLIGSLVSLVLGSAKGLARANGKVLKYDKDELSVLLTLGEALERGDASAITIESGGMSEDFSTSEQLLVDGNALAKKTLSAPVWIQAARAASIDLKRSLVVDKETALACLVMSNGSERVVYLEDFAIPEGSVDLVRIWTLVPDTALRGKGAASIKGLLGDAWETGQSVGMRKAGKKSELCIFRDLSVYGLNAATLKRAVEDLLGWAPVQ